MVEKLQKDNNELHMRLHNLTEAEFDDGQGENAEEDYTRRDGDKDMI